MPELALDSLSSPSILLRQNAERLNPCAWASASTFSFSAAVSRNCNVGIEDSVLRRAVEVQYAAYYTVRNSRSTSAEPLQVTTHAAPTTQAAHGTSTCARDSERTARVFAAEG